MALFAYEVKWSDWPELTVSLLWLSTGLPGPNLTHGLSIISSIIFTAGEQKLLGLYEATSDG